MAGVDCLYYSLSSSGFVFQLSFYFGLNVDWRSKCYLIGMLKTVLACLCTCVPNSYSQIKALFDVQNWFNFTSAKICTDVKVISVVHTEV